jgi:putative acetyltransferase
VHIRDFRIGDETRLREVFFSSVHQLAAGEYGSEQLSAWAPQQYCGEEWAGRVRAMRPFVAEVDGRVVGYADVQACGYIDHFFVDGSYFRAGVGSAIMVHIHVVAAERGIAELFSDVSLSAEAFFKHHAFTCENRNTVVVRGVAMENVRMRKKLPAGPSAGSQPTPRQSPPTANLSR